MVNADAAMKHLPDLGADALRPVEPVDLFVEAGPLIAAQERQTREQQLREMRAWAEAGGEARAGLSLTPTACPAANDYAAG